LHLSSRRWVTARLAPNAKFSVGDKDIFLAEIKDQLLQAQTVMKTTYDKHHKDMEFAMGDWVWLHLNHRAATTIREGGHSKLGPKYFRPYQILERIGVVSYKLHLLAKACIHNVFHITFLKKFEGAPSGSVPPLSPIVRGRTVLQPEKVVCAKPTKNSWELLVQWDGRSTAEATWEVLEQFKEDYPEF
jgi:hypothetical protein